MDRLRPSVVIIALLGSLLGADGAAAAASTMQVTPVIRVEVPDRFGFDRDGDGLIDMASSTSYVHGGSLSCNPGCEPAAFPVILDGSLSILGAGASELAALPILRYAWTVHGVEIDDPIGATGPMVIVRLPEGDHWVELTVTASLPWGSIRFRTGRPITVEDLLVVAIGDSYASGEGNPEVPRGIVGDEALWGDGAGDAAAEQAHADAHRSSIAWPARVALALEAGDSQTSVTFISAAASSARISEGLLGPQPGIAGAGQLDQVAALVGDRKIDYLLISIGGNDIGFSRIIRELVDADRLFDPLCYSTDLANVWAAAIDGDWNRSSAIRPGLPLGIECAAITVEGRPRLPGLEGLPAELDRLAEAIAQRLRVDTVVLAEYPDPTGRPRTGSEDICGEIVGDIFPPFRFLEIDHREQEEGRVRIIAPLNAVLESAAARHGWVYAGGVAEAFADGHGYCAEPPSYQPPAGVTEGGIDSWFRNPGTNVWNTDPEDRVTSWFRTAAQSSALQGPQSRYETEGTLHPNELGHTAIAELVLAALG